MNRKKLTILTIAFITLGMLAIPSGKASVNAVGLSCPTEVRIGNLLSCKATGLTVGTNYIAIAVHSDGNISKVLSATSSVEYFRFTFTTADADGLIPIELDTANATGVDSDTTTYDAASLVNLINPAEDIPSSFFQNLLAPVLIIGIFVLLMAAFFIKRKMK